MLARLKTKWIPVAISVAIIMLFLLHVSEVFHFRFLEQIEKYTYDTRLVLTMPNTVDENVVIIDIDERSLAAEGRWPWSRDRLAVMVNRLFDEYKISLLAFDVVFAEPDDSSGLKVLEKLGREEFSQVPAYNTTLESLRTRLDHDQQFAEALKGRAVVMGYYFNRVGSTDTAATSGALPGPMFSKKEFRGKRVDFRVADGYGANLPQFQKNALSAGHFNPGEDLDGVVRCVPMLYEYEEGLYESLALSVTRNVLNVDKVDAIFAAEGTGSKRYAGLEWLGIGSLRIPVDRSACTLVPYRGRKGSFTYVSATDVIHGKVETSILKGAIVLLGTTAPGLQDLRTAPVQSAYPGVEVHANLISGILNDTVKEKPAYTTGAEFLIVVLVGLLLALGLPLLSPVMASVFTVVMLAVSVAMNMFFWSSANLVIPLATSLVMIIVLYVVNMSYGYFVETRGKRQLAGLFGQYVPPELVDEMSVNPEAYSLDAENREMSVLFSDVRGFTTISEGLSPQALSELMNAVLTPMTHIIHNHRGTIDKYMGDAIMAFWGAPLDDPDHARHALEAGLKMLQKLDEIQPEFRARGWPEIRIGVGVNTGEMSVGNMGSEFRMAYTVLGDTVNLGSRLEGLTKGYGVAMIVNETTVAAVPEYAYRELDKVRVKGKDKPVAIYEPVCPREELDKASKDELKLYEQALKYYRSQEWDLAELQFLNLSKMTPERMLYSLYVERIKHFRSEPPGSDWDGVYTHTSK